MVVPGPPIAMSGLLVTTKPEWLLPVQLAVLGLDATEPDRAQPDMPDIPLMAVSIDCAGAAG